jgi:hypothetical protein
LVGFGIGDELVCKQIEMVIRTGNFIKKIT